MILSKASEVRSPRPFGVRLRHLAAALAVVAFVSGTASAEYADFTFQGIWTADSSADEIGIGEAQLGLRVTDEGNGQVSFTFKNEGSESAVIAAVYFYDGDFLENGEVTGQVVVADGSVSFAANPENHLGHLPGISEGNNPTAVFFSADPTNQPPYHGVNPGESLTITFDLKDGIDFQAILDAIAVGNRVGGLVVGVHVISIGEDEGSESFTAVVPEPASIAMLGFSSLVGLGYAWRRRGRVVA